jgi:Holliday junction resolvasome RuvABC endonuclease subunit
MTQVVGIDPGITSAGLVRIDKEGMISRTIGTKPDFGPRWERYRFTMATLKTIIEPADVVFMEDYNYGAGRNASSLVDMAEIGVLIKMTSFVSAGHWPFPVSIATVKKFLTGTGKGVKTEDLKLAVYKKHRLELETTDEIIAFGIAQLGRCILGLQPYGQDGLVDRAWHGYELESAKALGKSLAKAGRLEEMKALSSKKKLKKIKKSLDTKGDLWYI